MSIYDPIGKGRERPVDEFDDDEELKEYRLADDDEEMDLDEESDEEEDDLDEDEAADRLRSLFGNKAGGDDPGSEEDDELRVLTKQPESYDDDDMDDGETPDDVLALARKLRKQDWRLSTRMAKLMAHARIAKQHGFYKAAYLAPSSAPVHDLHKARARNRQRHITELMATFAKAAPSMKATDLIRHVYRTRPDVFE